jgi:hypothetical protein
MARRALAPGAIAAVAAFVAGFLIAGPGAGVSAALGVAVAVANFAGIGLMLAWAAGVSLAAYQMVGYGGWLVLLGVIVGLMFGLDALSWFSPVAFGLALVPGAGLVLGYVGRLWLRGLGGQLVIPSQSPDDPEKGADA